MKNKQILNYILGTIILISASSVYAKVRLDDIAVSDDDRMLFTVEKSIPEVAQYKSLYCTELGNEKIKSKPVLLTFFPERMELLNGGKILQIRNIDGFSRYSVEDGKLVAIAEQKSDKRIRTFPVVTSPDGQWYCTVDPVDKGSGKLVLVNSKTLLKKTLAEGIDLDYEKVNVKWSYDSKVFLYENNNCVYFATPDAVSKNLQINESFRKIGEGSIESVQWTQTKKILYINDDIVYSIEQNELYTRGLYSPLIGKGKIIARLPSEFNSFTDRFWCNGIGNRIAVISRNNIISLYTISEDEKNAFVKVDLIKPLTEESGTSFGYEVFFNSQNKALLWNNIFDLTTKDKTGIIYSIEDNMEIVASCKNSISPVASPDNKKIAYTDNGSLKIFDFSTMNEKQVFNKDSVVSVLWAGKNAFYVGGRTTVLYLNTASQEEKVLFLSSVDKAYWYGSTVVTKVPAGEKYYSFDYGKNIWIPCKISEYDLILSDKNGKYRAYTGNASNPDFENTIFVRCLSGKTNTYSIFPEAMEENIHRKKVALVIDAMENSEGLEKILHELTEYKVRGTFFVNGEFIRRYPEKTKLIAESENDCGSLFYTSSDLVENNYIIDKEFITRGLARNEDEFFSATGKELSLIWHAPYYHDTELIKDSAKSAGYEYISAFNEFSDRITYERAKDKKEEYLSASEIISKISDELYDGMVISVTIGKADGTRKDYVYQKLDLLISAIIESGYEITDVQGLK
ncbi:MAG: polysaccharide deacetylase family protein [Treponema sp.]|nr:polysaccharide deacetylase family protein [Spirochaetia bacterium]MDD7459444.1 polysaccharide deacetylase family protein [Spirochaetales bacterium]MDY5810553.1 polysaccharide deacetylase family protein [Treponema sp.]